MISDKYRLILFDCFNTLFVQKPAAAPVARIGGQDVVTTAGLLHPPLAELAPDITLAEVYRAHSEAGAWARDQRGAELREVSPLRRVAHMVELLGLPPLEPALLERLHGLHIAAVTGSFEFPAAHGALLERLSKAHRLALFSNFDYAPALGRLLHANGLTGQLDPIVISAEIGYRKPGRAAFERALALAGHPVSHALLVGDSLEEDVAGALAFGMDVAWVNPRRAEPPPEHRPTYTIERLEGLETLLGR
jgi:FMN phosphatase YigB (HAD superfamily)